MQNGMIPAQPTLHNRPYFVPTSKILIPPPSRVKHVADSLADSLAARFADSGGGLGPAWGRGGGGGSFWVFQF